MVDHGYEPHRIRIIPLRVWAEGVLLRPVALLEGLLGVDRSPRALEEGAAGFALGPVGAEKGLQLIGERGSPHGKGTPEK